jgi:hypothetical protein
MTKDCERCFVGRVSEEFGVSCRGPQLESPTSVFRRDLHVDNSHNNIQPLDLLVGDAIAARVHRRAEQIPHENRRFEKLEQDILTPQSPCHFHAISMGEAMLSVSDRDMSLLSPQQKQVSLVQEGHLSADARYLPH